jgi:hypothetical protein
MSFLTAWVWGSAAPAASNDVSSQAQTVVAAPPSPIVIVPSDTLEVPKLLREEVRCGSSNSLSSAGPREGPSDWGTSGEQGLPNAHLPGRLDSARVGDMETKLDLAMIHQRMRVASEEAAPAPPARVAASVPVSLDRILDALMERMAKDGRFSLPVVGVGAPQWLPIVPPMTQEDSGPSPTGMSEPTPQRELEPEPAPEVEMNAELVKELRAKLVASEAENRRLTTKLRHKDILLQQVRQKYESRLQQATQVKNVQEHCASILKGETMQLRRRVKDVQRKARQQIRDTKQQCKKACARDAMSDSEEFEF